MTWAKLANLDTLHWYCDRLEPTTAAQRYDRQVHQYSKRRAFIKQQVAKKKQEETQPPKGIGLANPSTKRKSSKKTDHLSKKPKVVHESIVGLKAETKKMVTPIGPGKGKGLMMGPVHTEKPPVLLCEASKYTLEQLSSIITTDDYEDLSNHATEAMEETSLFSIAQAMLMMKGLPKPRASAKPC
ncbi:uncharacterized protein LOC115967773 [Quercus lobata]|uniref:uncharacterized protein LOC115967773 n=1 Tax=Quercus lobata TaxID=97700 RepID=UPI001246B7F7|nr:uncharacterized protein LOC115967773 [Quercus lobata]